jgi:CRISPR-associated protein Cas2
VLYFDLPVVSKRQREAYTKFRAYLLDEGFEMAQFSVYMRHCSGKEAAEALTRRVEFNLPSEGKVYVLQITDKQFENTTRFICHSRQPAQKNPAQLALF